MSLGVLCPGQGAQHSNMLGVIAGNAAAATVLDLGTSVLGSNLRDLVSATPAAIFINVVAQPLLCAVELATWAALSPLLPEPKVFAGYSIGEVAAYGCAGALSPGDAIHFARERARCMDEACGDPCSMSAVHHLNRERIAALAQATNVQLAIINDADRYVVGGTARDMTAFGVAATAAGATLTSLPVHIASHTSLLSAAVEPLRLRLSQIADPPRIPVLAGVDGTPVMSRERMIDTLSRQTAQTVDWAACLHGLREMGCRVLLELGPGCDLARMARRQMPDIPARCVAEFRSLEAVASWIERHA